jgi:Hint domain
MAAPTSQTFGFGYEVNFNAGTFTLKDSDPSTPNKVDPLATGAITVTDPNGGKVSLGQSIEGSVNGVSAPSTSSLVFVAQANVQDHGVKLPGIVIEDTSDGKYYFLTDTKYTGNLAGNNGHINVTKANDTFTCFLAGTIISTPDGGVPVETLRRGDLVLANDGRSLPVDWLGVQTVSMMFADKLRALPIRIKTSALAENVPSRDLLVSPDHALLIEGALIQAGALVNGTSIVRETNVPTVFTYYHVEVEDHSLILAENTPAETFVDNVDRLGFDNWAEHEALYPDGKQVAELPYPRAKAHRQVPVSIRVMLAARAQTIGAADDQAAVA